MIRSTERKAERPGIDGDFTCIVFLANALKRSSFPIQVCLYSTFKTRHTWPKCCTENWRTVTKNDMQMETLYLSILENHHGRQVVMKLRSRTRMNQGHLSLLSFRHVIPSFWLRETLKKLSLQTYYKYTFVSLYVTSPVSFCHTHFSVCVFFRYSTLLVRWFIMFSFHKLQCSITFEHQWSWSY